MSTQKQQDKDERSDEECVYLVTQASNIWTRCMGVQKSVALQNTSRYRYISVVTVQGQKQKSEMGFTHDQGSPVGGQGRRPIWAAAGGFSKREDLLAGDTALHYSEGVPISLVLAQYD